MKNHTVYVTAVIWVECIRHDFEACSRRFFFPRKKLSNSPYTSPTGRLRGTSAVISVNNTTNFPVLIDPSDISSGVSFDLHTGTRVVNRCSCFGKFAVPPPGLRARHPIPIRVTCTRRIFYAIPRIKCEHRQRS